MSAKPNYETMYILRPDIAEEEVESHANKYRDLVVEAGGATALAALISGAYTPAKGERVGVLVCGGNAPR